MKNTLLLKLTGTILLFILLFNSCRQESILIDESVNNHKSYNINYLNKSDISKNFSLNNKIKNLQEITFKNSNLFGKGSVQDSILEGAIIETDKVLEIQENGNTTYTFPLSRTFTNNVIENLVV